MTDFHDVSLKDISERSAERVAAVELLDQVETYSAKRPFWPFVGGTLLAIPGTIVSIWFLHYFPEFLPEETAGASKADAAVIIPADDLLMMESEKLNNLFYGYVWSDLTWDQKSL